MANPLIRFTVDKNKNIINIENVNTTQTAATFASEYEAYLFGINQSGSLNASGTCSIKMYSCQIYDNDILVRDFIPCITENGRIGLFDKIKKKFYGNNGIGNFVAGFAYENPINNLSESYTRLEYIESSGTQYINTGFKPSNTTRAVIDFQETTTHTDVPLFGARVAYKNTAFSMWLNTTGIQTDFGNVTTTQALSSTTARFRVDKNKNLTSIDAKLITSTSSTFTSSYDAYLFGLNQAGSLNTSGTCSIKLYSCQLYDNGVIVRNFVPCKNNLNNEIGLFDTINRVFYGNMGTGSFIAGPEISNTITIPKDKYIPLQYISSTGTQYIDTGVIGQADTEIYMNYKYNSVASNSMIIGSSGGSDTRFYPCSTSGYWGYGSYGSISQTLVANKDYELYCKLSAGLQTVSLNKTLAYSGNNSSAISSGKNMYLFAANWEGSPNYFSTASIGSCKIKQNGELVRDFVPCIQRSTNIVGMYDKMNDVFYTNQGSNNFIAGPELQYNLGKTNNVAEELKTVYYGAEKEFPIMGEVTQAVNITASNISQYFTVSNGSYYFKGSGATFTSNNAGQNSTTAQTTLTALKDMTVSFRYTCSSESNYDKYTITVNGTTVVNAVSGTKSGTISSKTVPAGKTIVFKYVKDGSQASGSDACTFSAMEILTTGIGQVGTETKEVAQKLQKAYFGDENGIARLVYLLGAIGGDSGSDAPTTTWKMVSGEFNMTTSTQTIEVGFKPKYVIIYHQHTNMGIIEVLKDETQGFIYDENGNITYDTLSYSIDIPDWNRYSIGAPLSNRITDTGFTFTTKSTALSWTGNYTSIKYYAWGQE